MSFDAYLSFGQIGESLISRWLRGRGNWVLPVYEKEINNGKGPRLFLPENAELIAPDLFVFSGGAARWIEAKHKGAFTWHRITERWVTGIDLRHYFDYLRVNAESPWPVWLLFLQQNGQAKDSPLNCPTGLYGGSLTYLSENENHRHDNWGRSGMVYWAERTLTKLAELDEIVRLADRPDEFAELVQTPY